MKQDSYQNNQAGLNQVQLDKMRQQIVPATQLRGYFIKIKGTHVTLK